MLDRHRTLELRAHALRAQPTAGEQKLWSAISGKQLGVAFRRQVPLAGRFIVDFVAPAARLVVEVDGEIHALKRGADARKDRALGRLGYRVLRLPDELVRERLDEAVAQIRAVLAEAR
jgi:very-short-patch-repair endonuclease